jgi:hypothetical protein
MRAINHAMTGAIIGLSVGNPVVAAGLALASHFVLDAVPHHGDNRRYPISSRLFTKILMVDATLCVALVVMLFILLPWWTAAAVSFCAFLATSPDLMWIDRFMVARRKGGDPGIRGRIQWFHAKVQWSETPQGKWIELVAAVLFIYVLNKLI